VGWQLARDTMHSLIITAHRFDFWNGPVFLSQVIPGTGPEWYNPPDRMKE
jgi:hypothetical protein